MNLSINPGIIATMQEIHKYSTNEGMNCHNYKGVTKSHIVFVVEQRFK